MKSYIALIRSTFAMNAQKIHKITFHISNIALHYGTEFHEVKVMHRLIIIFISLGLAAVIPSQAKQKDTKAPLTPVIVEKIQMLNLTDKIRAIGTTQAKQSVNITAKVTDIIQTIHFQEGESVKEGDTIIELEHAQEDAELKEAQANLAEHQRELNRLKTLLSKKATSQRHFDERSTQVSIAKERVKQAEARLNDRIIKAPFDGVVGLCSLDEGALVKSGELITTIDNLEQIQVQLSIPSLYLSKVNSKNLITATHPAFPTEIFQGKLKSMHSRVDATTGSIQVKAEISNKLNNLKPGMTMLVDIHAKTRAAMVIAEESVIQEKNEHYVLVVDEKTKQVKKLKIQIGERKPGLVEVLDGLKPGQQVITRGINKVFPGQMVEPKINENVG